MDHTNQLSLRHLGELVWSKWHIIFVTAMLAGSAGYAIGINATGNQQQPVQQVFNNLPILTPTNMPGDDGDIDYAIINGVFTTTNDSYDQVYITIDEWKNGITTRNQYDIRVITKPQVGVSYPYVFARLTPDLTYIVSVSACHKLPNGSMRCVDNIHVAVSNCSGKVQSSACIIDKSGTANFSLMKNK